MKTIHMVKLTTDHGARCLLPDILSTVKHLIRARWTGGMPQGRGDLIKQCEGVKVYITDHFTC